MAHVVLDKPYQFVPPHHGTGWPSFIQWADLYGTYLRKKDGIESYECRHVDRLQESLKAGHGILLCPNHCRTSDPLCMGWLARTAGTHVFAMASWHLFNEGRFKAWAIHKMGGFSLNREGLDRQAINTAIEILETAERPLILFPEGSTSRTNDHLHALLDGTAFIARTAAKKRAKSKPGSKVVVHPIGIKYLYGGDIEATSDTVLTDIERRLTWEPQRHLPLLKRIRNVGLALLTLKELEYFGEPRTGSLAERLAALIESLVAPIEQQWLGQVQSGPVIPRVKTLRMKLMPDMVHGKVADDEYQRRLKQLGDLQVAQQLNYYPPQYLVTRPSVDRVLETLERFEEDTNGKARRHGKLKVILEVAPPIEVSPERDRSADVDPLMSTLQDELQKLIDRLALESPEIR